MSSKNLEELLLDELKSHYKIELEIQKNLDTKNSSMIATIGTVTGLLFGFGTFLVTKIALDYEYVNYSIAILIIAICANLISFILCMFAFKIKKYLFLMREGLIEDENKLKIKDIRSLAKDENIDTITNYTKKFNELEQMTPSAFHNRLIKLYIISNAINKKNNDIKAKIILIAQIVFSVGLGFIPILLGFLINAYYNKALPAVLS